MPGSAARLTPLLLLIPLLAAAGARAEDLQFDRRCAWSRAEGPWIEAGHCRLEGWRDGRELLLTVLWAQFVETSRENRSVSGTMTANGSESCATVLAVVLEPIV